ncbi:MAG: hypothetical protein IJ849_08885 [Selenomonadaceae bacterium]|nr:hypothetical protein [Selenomonadaceae bacterium]
MEEIKGIVTALSPVIHSESFSRAQDDEAKNRSDNTENVKPFRRMRYIFAADNGYASRGVPVISGNSLRGVGRGLLVRHSLEDVLDITLEDILQDVKGAGTVAKFMTILFYKGGVTPKGIKADGSVKAETYLGVQRAIPWLDLLGGVYAVRHFESALKVGILAPVTYELAPLFAKDFPEVEPQLSLADIQETVVRHTRTTMPGEDSKEDSTQMIFAAATLPAGTRFYSYNVCHSESEGTLLAFRAMFALIKLYGFVGGMSSKGFGHVSCDYNLDATKAISEYDAYLKTHREEIIASILSIATDFGYTLSEKDKK